jgi:hypothetical protein
MAQFSFQIPDAKEQDIIDAWCIQEGYQAMILDTTGPSPQLIANPETKTQFAKKTLKHVLLQAYIRKKAEDSRKQAEIDATNEV